MLAGQFLSPGLVDRIVNTGSGIGTGTPIDWLHMLLLFSSPEFNYLLIFKIVYIEL